jgi:Serine hydrolase (FSH1)
MNNAAAVALATPQLRLRILCLHDGDSNADELSDSLLLLSQKLAQLHAIDLVHVQSPIVCLPETLDPDRKAMPRVWWEETLPTTTTPFSVVIAADTTAVQSEIDPDSTVAQPSAETELFPPQYRGLDASLLLLQQIWISLSGGAPFWGILGVGQGAAVASLLLALLERDNLETAARRRSSGMESDNDAEAASAPTPAASLSARTMTVLPTFAIFISGQSLVPVDEPLLMAPNDVNVLHLVDDYCNDNEEFIKTAAKMPIPCPPPPQQRLIRQFPHGTAHRRSAKRWDGSTTLRSSSQLDVDDLNHLGRFIVQQKKLFMRGADATTPCTLDTTLSASSKNDDDNDDVASKQVVWALQSALCRAEQEASECVARVVALNPPASLLAVIQPQVVGGWQGRRRRLPGQEGGGAPCPHEFVLPQHHRRASPERGEGAR